MWALIGLILTIGGTLLEAFLVSPPWSWGQHGVHAYSLGVTCQIAAVLLVGCLGGRNAATISQIAYLILGLTWFNVFTQGGGLDYAHRPSFGYLLGFVPGAWICGWLAFRLPVRLEYLAFSCLLGLTAIHLTGIGYILLAHAAKWTGFEALPLSQTLVTYSVTPLPGQLALVCAVTVIAALLRRLMLY
jgi:biotin transport system substrate-specific component